eukprot:sb/3478161/
MILVLILSSLLLSAATGQSTDVPTEAPTNVPEPTTESPAPTEEPTGIIIDPDFMETIMRWVKVFLCGYNPAMERLLAGYNGPAGSFIDTIKQLIMMAKMMLCR